MNTINAEKILTANGGKNTLYSKEQRMRTD